MEKKDAPEFTEQEGMTEHTNINIILRDKIYNLEQENKNLKKENSDLMLRLQNIRNIHKF